MKLKLLNLQYRNVICYKLIIKKISFQITISIIPKEILSIYKTAIWLIDIKRLIQENNTFLLPLIRQFLIYQSCEIHSAIYRVMKMVSWW